ncbi:DUF1580 domain-containing protein [bacterium]|nr:DUF1580 domain-containing protein [bacterium]
MSLGMYFARTDAQIDLVYDMGWSDCGLKGGRSRTPELGRNLSKISRSEVCCAQVLKPTTGRRTWMSLLWEFSMRRDRLLPFNQLLHLIRRQYGIRLHIATLYRWRGRGIRGQKMSAVRIGGRWFSSLADVLKMSEVSGETPVRLEHTNQSQVRRQLQQEFGL